MTVTAVLGRDDFKTLRTFFRFANAGVLPALDVAQRASLLIDDFRAAANNAVTVIESVRGGILPSQMLCQAAETEITVLYERGELDAPAPGLN